MLTIAGLKGGAGKTSTVVAGTKARGGPVVALLCMLSMLSLLSRLYMPRPRPIPTDLASLSAATPKQLPATDPAPSSSRQASRQGKAAITIFVSPESKAQIRAALADGGYGESLQKGLVALLNELLAKQNRPPIA